MHFFLGQKCVFYACFTLIGSWEGEKNLRVGIFLNKKLVMVGLQETNNFFFRPYRKSSRIMNKTETQERTTVKLVMFACSKYCVFFIFSFMRVLINATDVRRQISETEGTDLCVF